MREIVAAISGSRVYDKWFQFLLDRFTPIDHDPDLVAKRDGSEVDAGFRQRRTGVLPRDLPFTDVQRKHVQDLLDRDYTAIRHAPASLVHPSSFAAFTTYCTPLPTVAASISQSRTSCTGSSTASTSAVPDSVRSHAIRNTPISTAH